MRGNDNNTITTHEKDCLVQFFFCILLGVPDLYTVVTCRVNGVPDLYSVPTCRANYIVRLLSPPFTVQSERRRRRQQPHPLRYRVRDERLDRQGDTPLRCKMNTDVVYTKKLLETQKSPIAFNRYETLLCR